MTQRVWVVVDARDSAERDESEDRVLGVYLTEEEMNADLPYVVSRHSGEWASESVPVGSQPRDGKWRLDFHDTYTGESGDLGVLCASADDARQAAQRSWTDVLRDLDSSLYKQRVLLWRNDRMSATAKYDVTRGISETVTYTLRQVAS